MTRWVWDASANSGALREIWHDPQAGDNVDHILITAPDTHEMFLVLREELSQFLSEQGIFRDMLWYVDLLLGHVYGGYINAQGGAWLKTEFGSKAIRSNIRGASSASTHASSKVRHATTTIAGYAAAIAIQMKRLN